MDRPSDHDLRTFGEFAEDLIRETRSVVTGGLSRGVLHRLKPDDSFVTDIDLAVEDLVRSRIRAAFPDHGVFGEERSEVPSSSGYRWVVDPIDGTHSLRHRIPLFGTLLALQHDERSILGIIDLPGLDRTYVAITGVGARCNGRLIRLQDVESETAVAKEVIAIGERKQFVIMSREDAFDTLMRAHGSVRTYCDCFGHAMAVEGCVGAMVDYGLRLWDVAATEVLIGEAGGKLVHLAAPTDADSRQARYDVVFGKPTVVDWTLNVLGVDVRD